MWWSYLVFRGTRSDAKFVDDILLILLPQFPKYTQIFVIRLDVEQAFRRGGRWHSPIAEYGGKIDELAVVDEKILKLEKEPREYCYKKKIRRARESIP